MNKPKITFGAIKLAAPKTIEIEEPGTSGLIFINIRLESTNLVLFFLIKQDLDHLVNKKKQLQRKLFTLVLPLKRLWRTWKVVIWLKLWEYQVLVKRKHNNLILMT